MPKIGWITCIALLGACAGTPPAWADRFVGEVVYMAGDFCPESYLPADGRILSLGQNSALFQVLGTRYGGNGTFSFALPNLEPPATKIPDAALTACIAIN